MTVYLSEGVSPWVLYLGSLFSLAVSASLRQRVNKDPIRIMSEAILPRPSGSSENGIIANYYTSYSDRYYDTYLNWTLSDTYDYVIIIGSSRHTRNGGYSLFFTVLEQGDTSGVAISGGTLTLTTNHIRCTESSDSSLQWLAVDWRIFGVSSTDDLTIQSIS